jgi:uncharacterized tellurite resistance protein B-like protein
MRTYPTNSPQAAARIVALSALADGHLCRNELQALERLDVHGQLGLDRSQWNQVVQTLVEDLMATASAHWGTACRVDEAVLASLLDELDDPPLRRQTLQLCVVVVMADRHLSDGEETLITAAAERWRVTSPAVIPNP